MKMKEQKIKLMIVSNRKLCLDENLESQCEKIFLAYKNKKILENFEIIALSLRESDLEDEEYINILNKISPICEKYKIPLYIHEKFYLNIDKFNVQGIHLKFNTFKSIIQNGKIKKFKNIFVSIHSLEEAKMAQKLGATHLIAGHIFNTECKKNLEARGLKFIKDLALSITIPILAIGGFDENNVEFAIKNGAFGVCMMSKLMKY